MRLLFPFAVSSGEQPVYLHLQIRKRHFSEPGEQASFSICERVTERRVDSLFGEAVRPFALMPDGKQSW